MFVRRALAVLLAGTAAVGVSGVAEAQTSTTGTAAGTVINNTASVTYTVNGTSQSTNSNTATFVVDKKVNFTVVTNQTGYTSVNLGQQGAVTTYKVTNFTNDVQDFLLDPDQNISIPLLPGTDNFDIGTMRVYVDSNGNGTYDAGVDTQTYIDELAPDASAIVFIVGNIPTTPSATLAQVSLHVTVAAGGATGSKGTMLIPTDLNLANADNTVDIVFADNDTDDDLLNLGDSARNGQGRAYSGYEITVRNVNLTVAKSAKVISDGVNVLNPKAIPGAVVEYCLRVNNATLLTPATGINLTDVVPANTTYVPGSISVGVAGVLGIACNVAGSTEDDDADDSAEVDGFTGAYDSSTKTMTAHIDTVPGGTSYAASFRVTIN